MKKLLILLLACLCLSSFAKLRDHWFYTSRNIKDDQSLAELCDLVTTASQHHYNGMLYACGVEACWKWDDARKERFAKLRRHCDKVGIEIIPIIWSIGYGTMLGENPNLIAGFPTGDLPFVVNNGVAAAENLDVQAYFLPNGDFEQTDGNRIFGPEWTDKPGVITFVDHDVSHSGKTSLRIEGSAADRQHGHARVFYKNLKLLQGRRYKLSCWVKNDGVQPNRGAFRMQFYSSDSKTCLSVAAPALDTTGDWKQYSLEFNSKDEVNGNLYIGMWGVKEGRLWIDDIKIELLGLSNPLRRPGTPFTVKHDGKVMREGADYIVVPAKTPDASLTLSIPNGSQLKHGDRLQVSYYVPIKYGNQSTTCMSEPELYELFKKSAAAIKEIMNPQKWFLSMDEIRSGGTCAACEARHTDMAHILADCITKQRQIIKDVCPNAEIYIWSDMLDPAHNSHDNYMNCKGTFAGVWNLIPKDLIISCWWHEKRDISMPFFSNLGFRTQGAAYYDVDTLDTSREWLETCKRTPGCVGIMYTSWRNKYALLPAFGDMVGNQ